MNSAHWVFRYVMLIVVLVLVNFHVSMASRKPAFEIKALDSGSVLLDGNWKYHEGDDSLWASPVFDDSSWDTIAYDDRPDNQDTIHWYRLTFRVDSSLFTIPLAMLISQVGASEIYLDGIKLCSYGKVSFNSSDEEGYDPKNKPLIFNVTDHPNHTLAIRYSNHISSKRTQQYAPEIQIYLANTGIDAAYDSVFLAIIFIDCIIGFFIGLTFLHLLLYFFYRADKNNLYYSLFTGTALVLLARYHIDFYHTNSKLNHVFDYITPLVYCLFFLIVFLLGIKLFGLRRKGYLYLTLSLTVLSFILYFTDVWLFNYIFISLIFNVCFSTVFLVRHALKNKIEGSYILGTGLLIGVLFILIMLILTMAHGFNMELDGVSATIFFIFLVIAVLSVPVSMSVYLARNFASKSNILIQKLAEVQQLSEQSALQAKEKEEILSSQNIVLEELVIERTLEVTSQRDELEKRKEELEIKGREITDSLHYARYLQEVILPPLSFVQSKVKDSFILYKPKDIVAGDFYYAENAGDYFFIAAADCTGHGVPGAMLSVLCSNALNQAIKEFGLTDPATILDKVNNLVSATFEKSNQDVNDGMDISLLAVNRTMKIVKWAGANIPIWLTMENQLYELKGDKQPIGKHLHRMPFTSQNIPWNDGTWFYLLTDGFADQFGGHAGKKFMRKNLFELINSIQDKTGKDQYKILNETFLSWSGKNEQVDDMTIIGIKV